jgi:hypothetical protein
MGIYFRDVTNRYQAEIRRRKEDGTMVRNLVKGRKDESNVVESKGLRTVFIK